MALVYEQCGNCGRRGAYVVAARGVVRCKYCTASEECKRLHPSNLGAVAAKLHAVEDSPRRNGRVSSNRTTTRRAAGVGIAGGVMSMDLATMSVLAGGATRHRTSYPTAKAGPAAPPRPKDRQLTAVVVDDDDTVRAIIAATLERGGMSVTEISSGEEACAAIVAEPPDIVILDLFMPGMDGLEVLVELRRRCDIGIIVVSGRSSEGDKVVARQLGADDFVAKPFAPGDLMARVEAVIAARSAGAATASSTG